MTQQDPFVSPDFDAMFETRQNVCYFSGGEQISAWYFPPRQSNGEPAPALVICPGFTGTKAAGSHPLFIPGLTQAGYGTLLIDYRGWGSSGGERGVIDPHLQVEDVRNAVSYLATRDDVDRDRLALLGLSFGGSIATYAAAFDDRVKVAISVLGGVADGASWLRALRRGYEWNQFLDAVESNRRQYVTGGQDRMVDPTEELMVASPERRALRGSGSTVRAPFSSADAIMQFTPVDVVHRIAPRAVMWFAARHDPVAQFEQSRLGYSAARAPKRLVGLPGNDHYGSFIRHRRRILHDSLEWLRQHMHDGVTVES